MDVQAPQIRFQRENTPGQTSLVQPKAFAQIGAKSTTFDSFQLSRTRPTVDAGSFEKSWRALTHPYLRSSLAKNTKESGETTQDRVIMYTQLNAALSREGAEHFKNLLKEGVLTDITADDNHSTLYHLYAILNTPRARGVNKDFILNETVRLLNKPYLITQKFPTLSDNVAKQILSVRNATTLNRAFEPTPLSPLTRKDLKVDFSSDCVPSSVMYYMAEKNPSELTRHLNELTSPLEAFYEKAKLSEISPEKPEEALEVLKYYDIPYTRTGSDEVVVRVDLPVAGKLRMINDSQKKGAQGARTGIETAYQSALAYLPTRSYDPATGNRDAMETTVATIYQVKSLGDEDKQALINILQSSKSPMKTRAEFMNKFAEVSGKMTASDRTMIQDALKATSRGLTEMEKTLLETIIKDNGGVSSVTYQVVAGKANPRPGEETQSYLYGYTRSHEQTTADMVEALKMGEFVIIGITDTDASGAIVGGHEITLTGAFVDKKDGEIKFEVVDSDDDIPTPVIRSAKELIPRIHHAGMPNRLAQTINKDMENVKGYYVPGPEDKAQFTPMDMLNEPLPADMFENTPPQEAPVNHVEPVVPAPSPVSSAPATPKAVQRPEPIPQPAGPQQVEYVPVYGPQMGYYPQAPYQPMQYQPMAYQPVPYQPIYSPMPYGAPYGYAQQQPVNPFYNQYPQQPFYPAARNAA